MVSFYTWTPIGRGGRNLGKGYCLSTDTKPTETVANGSQLIEIDTGDVYLFNETGSAWVKEFTIKGE